MKTKQEDFSSITAGLASPQMISLGRLVKSRNQKLSTTEPLSQKEMVFFVQRFLAQ